MLKPMRKIIVFVISLLSACHINAQSFQDPSNAVQLSDNFDQTQMRVNFYAENRDFCDYHVEISFSNFEGFAGMPKSTFLTITKGKQQILNYKVREGARSYSYKYTYVMYRGNANKLPNSNFAYRLPVTDGGELFAEIAENIFGYQLKFHIPNDTIYACRGGVVCDDNLKDFSAKGHQTFNTGRSSSQITIYHADGSFGEYVFKGKSLVNNGKTVKMGDPIAIVQKNDIDEGWLLFSAYFLDKNKVKDQSNGHKHTHFRPFFQTYNHGKIRLENKSTYICEQTEEMFMQDMNKRERKAYLKKQAKIN
jgi:hypothetical protein